MAVSFKGAQFPAEIIRTCGRWYVAYPFSTRHVEEPDTRTWVHVDHSTVNRSVIKYSPPLEDVFRRCKRQVWVSWRMDETSVGIKGGSRRYLYRAVDKQGQTIDFLLRDTGIRRRRPYGFCGRRFAATVCLRRLPLTM